MPTYFVEAVAYDANGRRLSGNIHKIDAATQADAERTAQSRQKTQRETVRVDTKVTRIENK